MSSEIDGRETWVMDGNLVEGNMGEGGFGLKLGLDGIGGG